jgi:hypothetical protein
VIDENVRRLVGATLAHDHSRGVDSGAIQALALHLTPEVVSNCPYVSRAKAQLGARNHGAGHLASGAQGLFAKRDLARVSRILGQQDQGVGSIQANA